MVWAKDFSSNFALKAAGILCVFQGFHKRKLGEKIRPERKKVIVRVALLLVTISATTAAITAARRFSALFLADLADNDRYKNAD